MSTPSQRSQAARVAAFSLHASHDPYATTAPARAAFIAKFARQVDPEGILEPAERERRAQAAMRAHMAALALKSSRARQRGRSTPVQAKHRGSLFVDEGESGRGP